MGAALGAALGLEQRCDLGLEQCSGFGSEALCGAQARGVRRRVERGT